MSEEDRLILLSIAAEELGYSPERLRQFIRSGRVQGARRGRLYFLRESEIEQLRREGRQRKPKRPKTVEYRSRPTGRLLRCAEPGPEYCAN
jgi:hypothetical protein